MVLEDIISPVVAIFSTFPGWLKFACFLAVVITAGTSLGFALDALQVPHSLFQTCTYSAVSDDAKIALYQFAGYEKATRTSDIPLLGNVSDNPCLPCLLPRIIIPTGANLSGENKSLYAVYDPNMGVLDALCASYHLDPAVRNRTELLYGASDCLELERSQQVAEEVNARLAYCSESNAAYGCKFSAPKVADYLFGATIGTQRLVVGNDTVSVNPSGTFSEPGTVTLEPNKAVCTQGLNLLDPMLLLLGSIIIELCVFAISYYQSMSGYLR